MPHSHSKPDTTCSCYFSGEDRRNSQVDKWQSQCHSCLYKIVFTWQISGVGVKTICRQHRQSDRDWTTFTSSLHSSAQCSSCLTNHPERKPCQSHIYSNSACEWGLWIVFYMVIQPWKSKRKQKDIHVQPQNSCDNCPVQNGKFRALKW